MNAPITSQFKVNLPGGGIALLKDADEVKLFESSKEKYISDYQLTKLNDLVLLGALLFQQILMFRAQRVLSGIRELTDNSGVGTGTYEELDEGEIAAGAAMLQRATDQIRGLEKALGIDKVTREAGGAYNLADYIRTLKKAAHERGIHISKRFVRTEKFANELRWRIRGLRTWDAEDRSYHDLTPETIINWAEAELAEMEQMDKDFANEKGRLYVGRL